VKRLLPVLLALAAPFAGAASPTLFDDLTYSNKLYTAEAVDELLEGAGGGGADLSEVSNVVAAVVAEGGASVAATETWRIILADHQRRLDALEDSDGTDVMTEAEAEQMINARMDTLLDDIENAWGDTSGCIPIQTTTCNSTTISANTSGVAAELSPLCATRYYASTANNRTLSFSSFSGVGNNPCLLVLQNFSSVSFPSGAFVETSYSYNNGAPNLYAVYKVNGSIFVKKIYP
jgi:hypothetical protein